MSDRPTFEERIADPLSHFPYKHERARSAVGGDAAAEYEVDATAAYVEAQEEYLRNPSTETRAAERAAAVTLQEARRARRKAREQAARGGLTDDEARELAAAAILDQGEGA